jgi:hypothetical protein
LLYRGRHIATHKLNQLIKFTDFNLLIFLVQVVNLDAKKTDANTKDEVLSEFFGP